MTFELVRRTVVSRKKKDDNLYKKYGMQPLQNGCKINFRKVGTSPFAS